MARLSKDGNLRVTEFCGWCCCRSRRRNAVLPGVSGEPEREAELGGALRACGAVDVAAVSVPGERGGGAVGEDGADAIV